MTKQEILDPDTWVHVVAVLERAHKKGLDPAEQLHAQGLLLTPALRRQLRVETMQFLVNELTSWRPAEMLRVKFRPTHTATPADMYSAIVAFLDQHITYARDHDDAP